jgi:hypothetical protein
MGAIDSAVDRLSSAFGRGYRAAQGPDVPGPPLHVSPFRPGEVTGEGIAVKAIASLLAGRRAAANQRLVEEARQTRMAHERALTDQLNAKLNPPTTMHQLPSGESIPVTDEQYLSHYSAFHPRPAAQGARIHMSAEEAAGLHVPFDPETGTAPGADVGFRLREQGAKDVERRFQQSQGATQTRFDTSQKGIGDRAAAQRETQSWTKLIGDLDKNEAEVERDALARHLGYGQAAARILQDPNASPTLRAKSARQLGVGYARNPADNTIMRDPTTQQPMYDLTGLPQRVKDFAARNAARVRANVINMHAADRLYYSQRLHDATGRYTGQASAPAAPAAAPSIDFAPEELEYLRRLGVPMPGTEPEPETDEADTTWYDAPAGE